MNVKRIGIDLAKQVFQVHGVDSHEQTVLKKKLKREQMLPFFRDLPACLIGLEACSSAHHWGRELEKLGHTVKLIAPQFVKPYVKANKNDANDAEAICEAVSRPTMRFVAIKTVAQQDLQATHRIRSQLVSQRTEKANQIRGLLAEYGIVVGQRLETLRKALPGLLEDGDNHLTSHFRSLLNGLKDDLIGLDERVKDLDKRIQRQADTDPGAKRLQQIPGIGPITATALVSGVGDGKQFKRGRDMAAWLGLTPGQHSSGGKERLLGISKRGDAYLRTLLIHGARAVLKVAGQKDDPRSRWLQTLSERRNKNIAAVALANKNARIAWALLSKNIDYQPDRDRPAGESAWA
ncbi:IS110 family transposase [Methylomonas sp. EFPC3]|uniref:IS110 family transposase n=1 Tax=Methylomonas sp. EFPC3 TaxID=3021710 RepID=UPI00241762AC|nr:IS110 family transposase [Methylomonas sp. EFPC3]WFP48957.1 IS110 family transposase [Methylomonas sp. EFPC3]WFP50265.1 IS110 family transposase [Methylomonas sp. EFPC3]WFP50310.1 IS110 family transposase [Methylomonas sp. EFPC3]